MALTSPSVSKLNTHRTSTISTELVRPSRLHLVCWSILSALFQVLLFNIYKHTQESIFWVWNNLGWCLTPVRKIINSSLRYHYSFKRVACTFLPNHNCIKILAFWIAFIEYNQFNSEGEKIPKNWIKMLAFETIVCHFYILLHLINQVCFPVYWL